MSPVVSQCYVAGRADAHAVDVMLVVWIIYQVCFAIVHCVSIAYTVRKFYNERIMFSYVCARIVKILCIV